MTANFKPFEPQHLPADSLADARPAVLGAPLTHVVTGKSKELFRAFLLGEVETAAANYDEYDEDDIFVDVAEYLRRDLFAEVMDKFFAGADGKTLPDIDLNYQSDPNRAYSSPRQHGE